MQDIVGEHERAALRSFIMGLVWKSCWVWARSKKMLPTLKVI